MSFPALYISHGSPRLIIEDSAARDFMMGFAKSLPKPRAIVIASAHFGTSRPAVVGDERPAMIYDFGGMPQLRQLVYPAPGDPVVATKIAGLFEAAGFAPAIVTGYGYDHGTWVPLMLLYPEADVPVVVLSVQPQMGPAHHIALGRALASLRDEDMLVIGSGSMTQRSVTTRVGPLVRTPSFSRLPLPVPWPSEVTKSSLSTKARLPCAMMMNTSPQEVAISGAPPPPGSRTLGLS